jgi:uncharacterized protein
MKTLIQAQFPEDSLLRQKFAEMVRDPVFPCLGAKAAYNSDAYKICVYQDLADPSSSQLLALDLEAFQKSEMRRTNEYATFAAVFREPGDVSEEEFENLLWSQLQQLHDIDAKRYRWDGNVSSDPRDPHFSFSFAGEALYVIGMHAHSSRLSRRFPWPTLVFNPHAQFERLRHDGKWQQMRAAIRKRDVALQGNINPMLSDFGESSEARQYSGRSVDNVWRAPFHSSKGERSRCPFGH